jgi:hypothetical protein
MKRIESRTWFLLALISANTAGSIVSFMRGNPSAGVVFIGLALLGCVRIREDMTGVEATQKTSIE